MKGGKHREEREYCIEKGKQMIIDSHKINKLSYQDNGNKIEEIFNKIVLKFKIEQLNILEFQKIIKTVLTQIERLLFLIA